MRGDQQQAEIRHRTPSLLGDITESTAGEYGSLLENSSNGDYVHDGEEDDSSSDGEGNQYWEWKERQRSIHKINPANVMLSVRPPLLIRSKSLAEQFAMVPSEMGETMRLVTDPSLEPDESGALYYAEDAYYNIEQEPSYALTVHPELYQQVLEEVVESKEVPCGLYFCCHGGDGAHAGLAHDDYVDIRIAWTLVVVLLAAMLILG